ncbi:hypothetical protein DPMN_039404 [Dreissena polymorpha]|uniref:Uncharacterized protein n=1 Tax=Dreissena polymorpha TaxID=45954 RepID=A0A9D4MFW9_DREPO|nr:hypothetical protein DPMN_039404 [Dreissena polymorpha]
MIAPPNTLAVSQFVVLFSRFHALKVQQNKEDSSTKDYGSKFVVLFHRFLSPEAQHNKVNSSTKS